MKILLICFVFLLTSVVGCSSKSTKEKNSEHSQNDKIPSKNESQPLPNKAAEADSKKAPTANQSVKSVVCKRDSETRNLSIEEVSPKGCQLIYSNFNPTKPVAWSSKGNKHCESVMDRIKGKLETANFKCQ